IGAGRPATLRAIESALKSDSHLIFAVAQRENVDTVNPGVLYTTGTIAKISQIQRGLGGVQLLLHGESRATALHYSENGRYLEIPPGERQGLLETLSVEDRLRRVLVHVQRQIGVLDAQEHIKSQVQEELGERQREMFLREQLKAIHKELGEEDEVVEGDELRKRFAALELPEAAKKEV